MDQGSGNPASLRALLISLLTMVGGQERLGWPTHRDAVLQSCLTAHGQAARGATAHETVDAKSAAADAAREMRDLLWKACTWLRGEVKQLAPEAADVAERMSAFRRAIDEPGAPFASVVGREPRPLTPPPPRPELSSREER